MRVRPISWARLVELITERITERLTERIAERSDGGAGRLRVGIDGAPAAAPDRLADALIDPLRVAGHLAVRVSDQDYLRPASLRFERGRTDPDSRYEDFLDADALNRAVLRPLEPGGSGLVRPRHWDAVRDRASREGDVPVPEGGVLLLSGELLLGRGLLLDLSVHLSMSPAALRRHTPDEAAWSLPAYARYAREVDPAACADVVVLLDDPRRPALVERSTPAH